MNSVQVNGFSLPVVEINGQRVVTLSMIDSVHERPEGTAGRNFRENRDRLIEGVDYFRASSDEIRRNNKNAIPDSLRRRDVVLLAEQGYLMLVKSLTDDLAWEVQRELVNCYFRARKAPVDLTRIEILQMALESESERIRLESENRLLAQERDHAVATKALIGSRREAQAMASASSAKRKVKQLENELGRGQKFATVRAVENATGEAFPKNVYVSLRKWCKENGVAPDVVPDQRYGEVKAWPAEAWLSIYGIDLVELFGNRDSRSARASADMLERALPELIADFRSREGGGLRPNECLAKGVSPGCPAD